MIGCDVLFILLNINMHILEKELILEMVKQRYHSCLQTMKMKQTLIATTVTVNISERFLKWSTGNSTLSDAPFGFKKHHSTIDAIILVHIF